MRDRINNWSARGWQRLEGEHPRTVALRERVLSWLDEVPEPHRTQWDRRLKSNDDPSYYSVTLELFLHHFFNSQGWEIAIEPELPGTSNRPDFLLWQGGRRVIVEAKVLLAAEQEAVQDARLMKAANEIGRKLGCTVSIHPRIPLPPGLPNKRIAAKIERMARGAEPVKEFVVTDEHQGDVYELEVRVLDLSGEEPTPTGVGVVMGQAAMSTTGHRLRSAIQEKAGKYGALDSPFVIVLWPVGPDYMPGTDDLEALRGDKVWEMNLDTEEIEERYSSNGIFREKKDGRLRWAHVSAVVFCQPGDSERMPVVYHNLDAKYPLDGDWFQGWQQHELD